MSADDRKDNQSAEPKNRPFIRETIMSEGHPRSLWESFLRTVLLAVCFGAVAAIIFQFTSNRFSSGNPTSPPVTLPQETDPSNPDNPTSPASKPSEDASWRQLLQDIISNPDADLKDYQGMALLINALGDALQWSLVTVTATNQDDSLFQIGHQYETQSFGVIVAVTEQELLILTPNDATSQLSDSSALQVSFADHEVADAYIKARDGVLDLMVMAVSRAGIGEQTLSHIKAITCGNSTSCYIGQPIVAMGAPIGGIINSFNQGVLTYIESNFSAPDSTLSLLHTNMVGDAASRGFLVGLEGSLIGWINADYVRGGCLTAIGISDLKAYIECLCNGTQGCYLGIEGMTLSDDLKAALDTDASGIFISRCTDGSPAQKAGLQSGDILTGAAGNEIRSLEDLRSVLLSLTAEQTIAVTILRKGLSAYQSLTYDVELERR